MMSLVKSLLCILYDYLKFNDTGECNNFIKVISAAPINPENAETQKKLRQQIQAEAGGGK